MGSWFWITNHFFYLEAYPTECNVSVKFAASLLSAKSLEFS